MPLCQPPRKHDEPGLYQLSDLTFKGVGTWDTEGKVHGDVLLSTPYQRIATPSVLARKKYQQFSTQDITPEMAAPEAFIHAFPVSIDGVRPSFNVEAVVIMPLAKSAPADVIHPVRTTELTPALKQEWHVGRGITATFPMSALAEGNELRIVYSGGAHEYRIRLDTKKIR